MYKTSPTDSVKREIHLKLFNRLYVKDISIFFDESREVIERKRANILDVLPNLEQANIFSMK